MSGRWSLRFFWFDVAYGLASVWCRIAGHRWVPADLFDRRRYLAGEQRCDRCHVLRPTWAGIKHRHQLGNEAFIENMAQLGAFIRDR